MKNAVIPVDFRLLFISVRCVCTRALLIFFATISIRNGNSSLKRVSIHIYICFVPLSIRRTRFYPSIVYIDYWFKRPTVSLYDDITEIRLASQVCTSGVFKYIGNSAEYRAVTFCDSELDINFIYQHKKCATCTFLYDFSSNLSTVENFAHFAHFTTFGTQSHEKWVNI